MHNFFNLKFHMTWINTSALYSFSQVADWFWYGISSYKLVLYLQYVFPWYLQTIQDLLQQAQEGNLVDEIHLYIVVIRKRYKQKKYLKDKKLVSSFLHHYVLSIASVILGYLCFECIELKEYLNKVAMLQSF